MQYLDVVIVHGKEKVLRFDSVRGLFTSQSSNVRPFRFFGSQAFWLALRVADGRGPRHTEIRDQVTRLRRVIGLPGERR